MTLNENYAAENFLKILDEFFENEKKELLLELEELIQQSFFRQKIILAEKFCFLTKAKKTHFKGRVLGGQFPKFEDKLKNLKQKSLESVEIPNIIFSNNINLPDLPKIQNFKETNLETVLKLKGGYIVLTNNKKTIFLVLLGLGLVGGLVYSYRFWKNNKNKPSNKIFIINFYQNSKKITLLVSF